MRDEYKHLYATAAWFRLRAWQLAKQPLCQISLALGLVVAADVVDHIIPHKGNRKLFFDPENLQSVSKQMHDTVCQQMEFGTWQPPLMVTGYPLQNDYLNYINDCKRKYGNYNWQYNIPNGLSKLAVPFYIVCGPPASGKTTYVKANAKPNDLVIDIDIIATSLGFGRKVLQGDDLLPEQWDLLFKARNKLLLEAMRSTKHDAVWLIGTMASPDEREVWDTMISPDKIIVLETPEIICLKRAQKDNVKRSKSALNAISTWWDKYKPRENEIKITQAKVSRGGIKVKKLLDSGAVGNKNFYKSEIRIGGQLWQDVGASQNLRF